MRACPGLHCGHRVSTSLNPLEYKSGMEQGTFSQDFWCKSFNPKELHYSGCSLAFLHMELNRSVPSSQPTESSGRLLLFPLSMTDSGVYIKLYIMATLKHFCEQHKCYLPASPSGAVLVWALHYLCEYCQISVEILKSSLSANSDGCHHNLYPKGHNKHKCISVLTTYTLELLVQISLHPAAVQMAAWLWAEMS